MISEHQMIHNLSVIHRFTHTWKPPRIASFEHNIILFIPYTNNTSQNFKVGNERTYFWRQIGQIRKLVRMKRHLHFLTAISGTLRWVEVLLGLVLPAREVQWEAQVVLWADAHLL